MFDWFLGSALTVSGFVVVLGLMLRYFRQQAVHASRGLREDVHEMTNESLGHMRAVLNGIQPILVVTLQLRADVPNEQAAANVAYFCQAVSDYDRTLGGLGLRLLPDQTLNNAHQLQLRFGGGWDIQAAKRLEEVRRVLTDAKGTLPTSPTWTVPTLLAGANLPFASCTATVAYDD